MNFLWLSLVSLACAQFDFHNLLGRIQQTTLKFDQQVEDIKNREQDEIRNIELRERALDRALETDMEKYHWKRPETSSFLESKLRRHKKHRKVEAHPITLENDVQALEETEEQRQVAEKEFLKVEKDIAELPEKLLHKSADMNVPLEESYEDDDN